MPNRFTDTTIWKKQKWFKKLSVEQKLAWVYIKDECDAAGVWKIDIPEFLEDLGLDSFDLPYFIECCNQDFDKKNGKKIIRQRIISFDEDHLWLTGFITYQYGDKKKKVNPDSWAVDCAFKILRLHELYETAVDNKFFVLSDKFSKNDSPLPDSHSPLPILDSPLPDNENSLPILDSPGTGVKVKVKVKDSNEGDKGTGKEGNGSPKKNQFNSMPVASDFNGLPDVYIQQAIVSAKIHAQTDVDVGIVSSLWEEFKLQNLTGKEYYSTPTSVQQKVF